MFCHGSKGPSMCKPCKCSSAGRHAPKHSRSLVLLGRILMLAVRLFGAFFAARRLRSLCFIRASVPNSASGHYQRGRPSTREGARWLGRALRGRELQPSDRRVLVRERGEAGRGHEWSDERGVRSREKIARITTSDTSERSTAQSTDQSGCECAYQCAEYP